MLGLLLALFLLLVMFWGCRLCFDGGWRVPFSVLFELLSVRRVEVFCVGKRVMGVVACRGRLWEDLLFYQGKRSENSVLTPLRPQIFIL